MFKINEKVISKEEVRIEVFIDGAAYLTSYNKTINKDLSFEYIGMVNNHHSFKPIGKGHDNYTERYNAHFWCIFIEQDQLHKLLISS